MAMKTREEFGKKKSDEPALKAVNIFDKGLDSGVKSKIDATADAWEATAPPPGGMDILYRVKLFCPQNSGYEQGYRDKENKKEAWYKANLECRLMDGDLKGLSVYADVSTTIRRGKDISTVTALMIKGGKTVPTEIDDLQQIRMLHEWLQGEPVLWVSGDWAAWSKQAGRFVYTKMIDFPLKEDGSGHNHIVDYKLSDGTYEEVNGRYRVKKWYNKTEAKELGWSANGMAGASVAKSAKPSFEDEEEETPKPPKKKPTTPVVEEEEEAPKKKPKKVVEVVEEEDEEEAPKPPKKKKPQPVVVEDDDDDEDVVEKDKDEDDNDDD